DILDLQSHGLLGPGTDSVAQPMFGSRTSNEIHPMVARRVLDLLWYLCRTHSRATHEMLTVGPAEAIPAPAMATALPQGAIDSPSQGRSGGGKGKGKGKGRGSRGRSSGHPERAGSVAMDVEDENMFSFGRAGAGEGSAAPLSPPPVRGVLLEQLIDLLGRPLYTMSGPNLDELLQLIEVLVSPLANLKNSEDQAQATSGEAKPGEEEEKEGGTRDSAAQEGVGSTPSGPTEPRTPAPPTPAPATVRDGDGVMEGGEQGGGGAVGGPSPAPQSKHELIPIPKPVVAPERLHLVCSVLRLDICSDPVFQRLGNVVRNLSRVSENKLTLLKELVSVAKTLGSASTNDLQALGRRVAEVKRQQAEAHRVVEEAEAEEASEASTGKKGSAPASQKKGKGKASSLLEQSRPLQQRPGGAVGAPPVIIMLTSADNELKLLRVLQTLHSLASKEEASVRADVLESILGNLALDALWDALSSCLSVVSVLEGVADEDDTLLEEDQGVGGGSGAQGA
ncbi:unnamed protein product, partial [Discosporangium mesarthrocarpum]